MGLEAQALESAELGHADLKLWDPEQGICPLRTSVPLLQNGNYHSIWSCRVEGIKAPGTVAADQL